MHLQSDTSATTQLCKDAVSLGWVLLSAETGNPHTSFHLRPVNLLLGPLSYDSLGGMLLFFPTDIHNSHAEHTPNLYQINNSQDICQVGSKSSCSWPCFWCREIAKSLLEIFWCIMSIFAYDREKCCCTWKSLPGLAELELGSSNSSSQKYNDRGANIFCLQEQPKNWKKKVGWKFWHTWITPVACTVTQSIHKVTWSNNKLHLLRHVSHCAFKPPSAL